MAVEVDLSEAIHASEQVEERLALLRRAVIQDIEEIIGRRPSAQKASDFQEVCRDYAANLQSVATKLSQVAVTLKARA